MELIAIDSSGAKLPYVLAVVLSKLTTAFESIICLCLFISRRSSSRRPCKNFVQNSWGISKNCLVTPEEGSSSKEDEGSPERSSPWPEYPPISWPVTLISKTFQLKTNSSSSSSHSLEDGLQSWMLTLR